MNQLNKRVRGKTGLKENVEYVLRGKDGNIKQLFQPTRFFRWLMKKGLVSPTFKANFPLFGHMSDKMVLANLVVNTGMAAVASRINGSGAEPAFTWIGIGIGTTGAAAADTVLETERDEAGTTNTNHKSASVSRVTTDVTNDTAQLVTTFNFSATLAITESGVFNASPDGVMLARQTFSAVNVVSGDSLQVTWKFDVDTA